MNKELIFSIIISSLFLWIGFFLLHTGMIVYGVSFFIILPFVLGYIFGNYGNRNDKIRGLVIAICLFLLILFIVELEGLICILMSLPLIIICIYLGILTNIAKNKIKKEKDEQEDLLKKSIFPFCLFLFLGITEGVANKQIKDVNEVRTEIILEYSSEEVYETIKSVDTLDAPKPFLMRLDLPVPLKCLLEEEKVGGIRRCFFEKGDIVERVTKLEKAKILQMDVIEYNLTGRTWLGFKEAIYTFEDLGDSACKMTRITTYTSELHPRFYWEPLEQLGISQEHEYVFRNLVKDLKNKY